MTSGSQTLSGASAAGAHGDRGADGLLVLQLRPHREDGRGWRAIVRRWFKNNGERDAGSTRRKFFELVDIKENARKRKPAHDISPVALEAVKRIDL